MAQPFIPVPNAMNVVLEFTQQDGSQAINEFWVQNTVPWTIGSMTTMLDAFITWFGTGDGTNAYKKFMNENISLVEVTGRDFTTQAGLVVSTNAGLPIAGVNATDPAPLGLTFCLTARTGLAGRSYRGRTYLVGLDTGVWSSLYANTLDGTVVGHMIDAFNALITAVPAAVATCKLVVCSKRHNGAYRDEGVTTPITVYGNHNLLTDFQRRRAPAHNIHL